MKSKPIIGVYGVTSVGKSTFLNLLLLSKEFEIGMGETTKSIHILQHINNNDKVIFDDLSIKSEYIKKDYALLNHFSIIDIPGTNKSFSDRDIKHIIDKLDTIIWIFDIQGDISSRDLNFLQNIILKNMINTIVVLNKIDTVAENIDIDEESEITEFIDDITSRKDTISKFFESNGALQLLSSIVPVSAKKLQSGIKKDIDFNYRKQHKKIQDILISISKKSFIENKIFRDDYQNIENIVIDKFSKKEQSIFRNKQELLESLLEDIKDKDIINQNFNQNTIINTLTKNLSFNGVVCSRELHQISQKIEREL